MDIHIDRFKDIDDGTLGEMIVNDKGVQVFKCYTLEPCGGDTTKRNQDKRVPSGLYNLDYHNSPRFKKLLPIIWNDSVPKDRYILIHSGNYPQDTQGCILVGSSYSDKGVFRSKDTLEKLLSVLSYQVATLSISNERLK
ncbi:hypothetical protein CFT13S00388_02515 [Campylobacter fetus subsp. testudinum]|uniref:DUF5675 family protein n=1 Tax=Campylobacter fetus TaxID=196 RepID=UPI000818A693|nr:DUF5675 family protein [Campylobacter fetus]OCR88059.1 hypothetical protein CFT13S00388_02515 [Campylobacter fetus subsp. testudinum]